MLKDFGKKLKETGENALDKTKKVAEITNLNLKISKSESDLEKAMLALGKKFYSNTKETFPQEYEAEFGAIGKIKAEIDEMKEKIAELKEDKDTEA